MGNYYNPPSPKDVSKGKTASFEGKRKETQGSGKNESMLPMQHKFSSGMPYAPSGRTSFNYPMRMTSGNQNGTNDKVSQFTASKNGLKANATAVANLYNGKPLNLANNRTPVVANGKPKKAITNSYTDRLAGTL